MTRKLAGLIVGLVLMAGVATVFGQTNLTVVRHSDNTLWKMTCEGDGVCSEWTKINGKFAGGTWTSPWKIDITDFVKSGDNRVEIEVVNNWINRLIGDSNLPAEDRITWLNENPTKPDDPLQSSGLMGPVVIEYSEY